MVPIVILFTISFQEVILYIGTTKSFEEIPNKKIHWPKRTTHPKDTPDCGFDGSLCKTESKPNESFLISISYARQDAISYIVHKYQTPCGVNQSSLFKWLLLQNCMKINETTFFSSEAPQKCEGMIWNKKKVQSIDFQAILKQKPLEQA